MRPDSLGSTPGLLPQALLEEFEPTLNLVLTEGSMTYRGVQLKRSGPVYG